MYDLLLSEGIVVDPANGFRGRADIAIENGRIAAVDRELPRRRARREVRVRDKWLLPGLIDTHVHVSSKAEGYWMMARAGVTCALDLAGETEEMIAGLRRAGVGLTVGFVCPLIPGETISGRDPGRVEIARAVDAALGQGALGVKVLGGHYPLTPEATARIIQVTHEKRGWCAVHAGTVATGSNIKGLEELVELAAGLPLQIAHVNSYCRGQVTDDPLVEASRALEALLRAPAARSESYLSVLNSTSAATERGMPKSQVTRTCLIRGGYAATSRGMENAITEGWAQVQCPRRGEILLLPPSEGLDHYQDCETEVHVSFPVNAASAAIALAVARTNGDFAVDALSTDGGGIPRNTTLRQGLALVGFGALSLEELVVKGCVNPARMLGLSGKGHIGPGADGDVIVVNPSTKDADWAIVEGNVVVENGTIVGHGGQLLTTDAGIAFLSKQGADYRTVAPEWLE